MYITTFPVSLPSFLHAAINFFPPAVTVSTHPPRHAKREDVAPYAIDPLSPSHPVLSTLHPPCQTRGRRSLRNRSSFSFPPRPLHTAPSRFPNTMIRMNVPAHESLDNAQRCLEALTPGYLEGTVVRGHPIVWPLALCPDDAKQDPVVCGAEFGRVFLAKCLTFCIHTVGPQLPMPLSLGSRERAPTLSVGHRARVGTPPDAHPACAGPPDDFNEYIRGFGYGPLRVDGVLHLLVDLPGRFDCHHLSQCTRWRYAHGLCLLRRHG